MSHIYLLYEESQGMQTRNTSAKEWC